ncbi:MAG: class I SAM-dependent methyltransferase [Dysgonamonadaceae bacterium]|jgi:23S rRNA (cytosine1962-C5)-methyltransferase|nr:class I SAM-dependent methyltransferase [Dysgonamonadaceae bacterium]
MELLTSTYWQDYRLIDSGNYEKLERFGACVLRRPDPQAVWRKALSEKAWIAQTDAWFKKAKTENTVSDERGEWILKPAMPQQWFVSYRYKTMNLEFRLGLTSFKHVGLFPEQAENWNYIFDAVTASDVAEPKVLNLFAYTGGASLAACAGGADVTHVDSVRQVVDWSRQNMEHSGLQAIRWVVEDALKFVNREVRRGNKYHGIILDPPAYGRGPKGEKWILEQQIGELMDACSRLLADRSAFCVLNLYSMGFSSLIAENLLRDYFGHSINMEFGELYVADEAGRKLPLGVFSRFTR